MFQFCGEWVATDLRGGVIYYSDANGNDLYLYIKNSIPRHDIYIRVCEGFAVCAAVDASNIQGAGIILGYSGKNSDDWVHAVHEWAEKSDESLKWLWDGETLSQVLFK